MNLKEKSSYSSTLKFHLKSLGELLPLTWMQIEAISELEKAEFCIIDWDSNTRTSNNVDIKFSRGSEEADEESCSGLCWFSKRCIALNNWNSHSYCPTQSQSINIQLSMNLWIHTWILALGYMTEQTSSKYCFPLGCPIVINLIIKKMLMILSTSWGVVWVIPSTSNS